jgi:hypothetical protein
MSMIVAAGAAAGTRTIIKVRSFIAQPLPFNCHTSITQAGMSCSEAGVLTGELVALAAEVIE